VAAIGCSRSSTIRPRKVAVGAFGCGAAGTVTVMTLAKASHLIVVVRSTSGVRRFEYRRGANR
jgi:hypothetical protein